VHDAVMGDTHLRDVRGQSTVNAPLCAGPSDGLGRRACGGPSDAVRAASLPGAGRFSALCVSHSKCLSIVFYV
jgi:hypothetical protein